MKKHKIISREEVAEVSEDYAKLLKKETHHNHEIIKVGNTLIWKPNEEAQRYLENISLNDLCPLLSSLGYGKNSEVYRKLYRDMGYSIFGYWEIFYWVVNNPDAKKYKPLIKP